MAEIKWIKLTVNMFDDEKIRLIQAMPEADAIIVIWVRLLTLAGKTNNDGQIYVSQNMPYNEEMLATLFSKPINTVRLALNTLKSFEMIDVFQGGTILINNWEKHQNIEGMEKVRELNRVRKQKQRERLRLGNRSHATSRDSHATDIEEDIDKDKERDKENKTLSGNPDPIPYGEIISYLNQVTGKSFKNVETHKKLIRARWHEKATLDDFKKVIDNKSSEWLGTDMAKYLQPSTLFGSKFDQYLNQTKSAKQKGDSYGGIEF
ncbi:phage replisome organizer N-terminal domain-containing protein [Latilactobacillus curvatus]|uniref:phage replisome organizer N-terminal domain-containing protein n=1 Tax=Latilactobacillus curvatus TaxID=28038 RepID=UPI00223BEC1E|nr:phage replisome organizer N-terminal domain-containing protein [Latilactobacillus curvatus]MCS8616174.1 replication protein [Latilactobacillus curvatus]